MGEVDIDLKDAGTEKTSPLQTFLIFDSAKWH